LITTTEYIEFLRVKDFKILHCGFSKKSADYPLPTNGDMIMERILCDEANEMYIPTHSLAKTEDLLKIRYATDGLLRHFHTLVFYRCVDECCRVETILELSSRTDDGKLLWNRCYTHGQGFSNSKWVDEYMLKLGYETHSQGNSKPTSE